MSFRVALKIEGGPEESIKESSNPNNSITFGDDDATDYTTNTTSRNNVGGRQQLLYYDGGESDASFSMSLLKQAGEGKEEENASMSTSTFELARKKFLEDDSRGGIHQNSPFVEQNTKVESTGREFERENRSICCMKAGILLILLAMAGLATVLVYFYAMSQEENTFHMEYTNMAFKVQTNMYNKLDTNLWIAHTLSSSFSGNGDTQMPWPNVTMANFEAITKAMLVLSEGATIGFSPLVTSETKDEWEAYAAEQYEAMSIMMGTNNNEESDAILMHQNRNRHLEQEVPVMKKEKTRSFLRHSITQTIASPRRALFQEEEEEEVIEHMDILFSFEGTSYQQGTSVLRDSRIRRGIYKVIGTSIVDETDRVGPFLPLWQISPFQQNEGLIFYNQRSEAKRQRAIDNMISTKRPILTEILYQPPPSSPKNDEQDDEHDDNNVPKNEDISSMGPSSILYHPIFEFSNNTKIEKNMIGATSISFPWVNLFSNVLPKQTCGFICVIEANTEDASKSVTYQINEGKATFLGEGNLHERKFSHMEKSVSLEWVSEVHDTMNDHMNHHPTTNSLEQSQKKQDQGQQLAVNYTLKMYPSTLFQTKYASSNPTYYATAVALSFLFVTFIFLIYDCLVERRNRAITKSAERSHSIVENLFPAVVRDRLFRSNENQKGDCFEQWERGDSFSFATRLGSVGNASFSPPIADHFTATTILFADIAGFTAWSSEREPAQVFQLLEALFQDFDMESKKFGIFKVETVGDCYVAVAGVPHFRPDHAEAMVKFAKKCLLDFKQLTTELEQTLGPGTAALGLRIGMHSGPVTGGVLRGDKSRFQLFGDTMNTASRMESTSTRNMIQTSQSTADLLIADGKGRLITARDDLVEAKGKGTMQTYWVGQKHVSWGKSYSKIQSLNSSSFTEEEDQPGREQSGRPSIALMGTSLRFPDASSWHTIGNEVIDESRQEPSKIVQRLITWNSGMLEKRLVRVLVHREGQSRRKQGLSKQRSNMLSLEHKVHAVANAVPFPPYNQDAARHYSALESSSRGDRNSQYISPQVRGELFEYVTRIASMYQNIDFHNFEHASHVTMSANKLMNEVCFLDGNIDPELKGENQDVTCFFSTFGIAYDPLVQLVVVFAALVHDVGHTGVPNIIRMVENPELAKKYKGKSLAENNSIDIACTLLMESDFKNLRKSMFVDDNDMDRFRQLLVNLLGATDIADDDRRTREKGRWTKAFKTISKWEDYWRSASVQNLSSIDVSLQATVVLEQIMLASDAAHTMQHWLTFVKWTEKYYREIWSAYVSGRTDKDPTLSWYEDQISFFNGHIIPLATKLKECGVFGGTGAEYLDNAINNRDEWIEKGKEISAQFDETIKNCPVDEGPNYWTDH
eukprot:scaffold234656_cov53-Attheya_sp.AAC.3